MDTVLRIHIYNEFFDMTVIFMSDATSSNSRLRVLSHSALIATRSVQRENEPAQRPCEMVVRIQIGTL